MRKTRVRLAPRGLLAGVALSLVGCDRGPAAPAPQPQPRSVEVVQIAPTDVPVEFEFVGRTESSQRVEIRARVSGYLDEIAYAEGEFVDEDGVLFQIDKAPFESRLRAAQAELAQHTARLENAKALLGRIEPLARVGAVAEKELDDAQNAVREAQAAVEGASARVFDAELNLSYTTITSPVHGLTGEATQRQGAYISSSTAPLTYVAKIDPIWAEFSVTESEVLQALATERAGVVRPPANAAFDVALLLSDGSEHPETGRLTFRDASVSTSTGSVLVRAEIPNPGETLRPGQYVRVILRGAVRPNAVLVPKRAVLQGPKGPFVWVIDSANKAEQRPVRLGPWHGDSWIVEDGLRAGDRAIVNGHVGLRPEMPTTVSRILPTPTGQPPSNATEGGSSEDPANEDSAQRKDSPS